MKLVNLTPHSVTILGDIELSVESSGVARIAAQDEVSGALEVLGISVPITKTVFGDPVGLPEAEDGVALIVSRLVAAALPERNDLFFPNQLVRDDQGRIIGCKSLSRI